MTLVTEALAKIEELSSIEDSEQFLTAVRDHEWPVSRYWFGMVIDGSTGPGKPYFTGRRGYILSGWIAKNKATNATAAWARQVLIELYVPLFNVELPRSSMAEVYGYPAAVALLKALEVLGDNPADFEAEVTKTVWPKGHYIIPLALDIWDHGGAEPGKRREAFMRHLGGAVLGNYLNLAETLEVER